MVSETFNQRGKSNISAFLYSFTTSSSETEPKKVISSVNFNASTLFLNTSKYVGCFPTIFNLTSIFLS